MIIADNDHTIGMFIKYAASHRDYTTIEFSRLLIRKIDFI